MNNPDLKPLVLMTRPVQEVQGLATALEVAGFQSLSWPMLEITASGEKLPELSGFSGLVFTSRQGVRFCAEQTNERALPVFAVGDATAEEARNAGFSRVISAKGDGGDLARLIGATVKPGEKLLHPGAEEKAEGWHEKISGIDIMAVTLYKAVPPQGFPEEVRRALLAGEIGYVLFFSPATARNFVTLLSGAGFEKAVRGAVAVCLSRMVAEAAGLLPWTRVLVAKKPDQKSLLEILMTDSEQTTQRPETSGREFPADPVIEAFGGIRPLATRLGLTASTVQGWKIRGVIPPTRLYDVVRAANEDGVDIKGVEAMLRALGKDGQPFEDQRAHVERRKKEDRRKQDIPVAVDRRRAQDRRSGLDRRHEEYLAHQKAQKNRVNQARMAFFDHASVTVSFVFMAVLLAAGVLLAPEFVKLNRKSAEVDKLQSQVSQLSGQLQKLGEDQGNISGKLNRRIEDVETGAQSMMESIARMTAGDGGNWQARLADLEGRVAGLGSVVVRADGLKTMPADPNAYAQMIADLRQAVANTGGDGAKLNDEVARAAGKNRALGDMLKGIEARDVGAAAMLIALNQFRDGVNSGRPFAQDLSTMKTLMGASPEMQKSLDNLAPYADHGILNGDALSAQLKGLSGDILQAGISPGTGPSVGDRALDRFSGLVKVRKLGDAVSVQERQAVVARAQGMLDRGDVRGALAELQGLEGPALQAASPFVQSAQSHVAADDATALLSRYIMARVASGTVPGQAVDNTMLQLILSGHPVDAILPSKAVPIISNFGSQGSVSMPDASAP